MTHDEWPKCPKCHSDNTRCWEEHNVRYYIVADQEETSLPVGFFVCDNCKFSWVIDPWFELGVCELMENYM